MSNNKRWSRSVQWIVSLAMSVLALGACSSIRQTAAPALGVQDSIAVVPMVNYTETPAAGGNAAAIAAGVLRTNGWSDVRIAPADESSSAMFDTAQRENGDKKLAWAREQHVKYVLSGAVEEWRYKTGVDGEPVAGVTLELIDAASGRVVWSATGTRTGWSRSSLSGVASTLIGGLLSALRPRS
ncbi:penicillin-binding protein activator LpoB [Paraburkholderia sp. NMBU_R16]|uniref:penicillin-binding protein activator LpoB n=1 Tax=Paraburkholderia sp. NMBU_R16 TaxID=2698676 RepID=UPI0015661C92|nr:penicillin-binding protein activator LpoB [Paraburkholderia sp. NMBU_R16]NRO95212.1 penicillin-binding protein activator LpoB [Paraburkholderia sp. NMBU_R16]